MNWLDIILVLPLLVGLVRGLMRGFISEVIAILVVILGVLGARYTAPDFSAWLLTQFAWPQGVCDVVAYTLIFLAPDTSECQERNYSDAQLDFLEAQLDAAAEGSKPVFVFTHYPASRVDQGYERYVSLMTKYPNTFAVVGHMHYYIRFDTIRGGEYRTPEIWVPCLSMMGDDGGPTDKTGLGYLMEVYDDTVVFRGINYYTGELTDVEQTYALQTQTSEQPDDDIPVAIGY